MKSRDSPISNVNFLVGETLQFSSKSSIDFERIKSVFVGQYNQRVLLHLDQGIDDELYLVIVEPTMVKVLHVIRRVCAVDDGSEWFSSSGAFVEKYHGDDRRKDFGTYIHVVTKEGLNTCKARKMVHR